MTDDTTGKEPPWEAKEEKGTQPSTPPVYHAPPPTYAPPMPYINKIIGVPTWRFYLIAVICLAIGFFAGELYGKKRGEGGCELENLKVEREFNDIQGGVYEDIYGTNGCNTRDECIKYLGMQPQAEDLDQ